MNKRGKKNECKKERKERKLARERKNKKYELYLKMPIVY